MMSKQLTRPNDSPKSRCARPDCSSVTPNQQRDRQVLESQLGTQSAFRGLIASESIANPSLRTSEINNTLVNQSNGLSQRCDLQTCARFQWLLKLSWVLSALLLITFFSTLYLCLALGNSRRAEKRRGSSEQQINHRVIYPHQECHNSVWSFNNEGSNSNSISINTNDDSARIRDDSSYLIEQHQQLMLNSLNPSQAPSRKNGNSHLIMGRSAETGFVPLIDVDRCQQQVKVKRRRSIGDSMRQAGSTTLPGQPNRRSTTSSKLYTNLKAKSRSQTTIYYDQGQDPFKAIPFNRISTGHLPGGARPQQISDSAISASTLNTLAPIDINGNYNYAPISNLNDEPGAHSLPPEIDMNQILQASSFNELASRPDIMQQLQRYTATKPTYMAPAAQKVRQPLQPRQAEQSSEFDPQNSRQLLDLIHQKHQQQIAQANRTAASINSVATMNFIAAEAHRHQRNKNTSAHGSIWR